MQTTSRHYARAWYELLKAAKDKDKAEISQNMLKQLQNEGKLAILSHIVEEVRRIEDEDNNVVNVEVRAARDVTEKDAKEAVKKLLGNVEFSLALKKDESLIGGLIVETANRRWDLSLKRQIENLKLCLIQ